MILGCSVINAGSPQAAAQEVGLSVCIWFVHSVVLRACAGRVQEGGGRQQTTRRPSDATEAEAGGT